MKRVLLSILLFASTIASTSSHAEALAGAEIKKLVGGKHVYLSTPYGLEFPLYYKAGGAVSGDASGFSMAAALAPKETGSWWIAGNKLCQKWPTWYDGKTICFTVNQTGASTVSWVRDDGMKGTARISD